MESGPSLTDQSPYAALAREHRLIERALVVLERFCEEIRLTRRLDQAVARELLRFLHEFADLSHHLKEERVLFPAIEEKTFFPGCGLVSEHELGRTRVRSMAADAERACDDDTDARKTFVQQAWSYISLIRSHIAKEDDCLARVTATAFQASEDRERLARDFDELERREVGEHAFERFAASVDHLESRFEVRATKPEHPPAE